MLRANSIFAIVMITAGAGLAGASRAQDADWKAVEEALGKAGTVQAAGIYRVSLPRTDLKVTLDGVNLKPGFALGGWLAFERAGKEAMVMGDLVLLETEANPVMKKLEQSGIEVTALHNHLLRSSPTTLYMHVMGHGDPVTLARELHEALSVSKTPFAAPGGGSTSEIDLDVPALDKIVGVKGKVNGGILQYGFPRAEKITDQGMPVPAALGTATGFNFQPTGGGKAAITGDFVLIGSEVTPALRALRENGIEVTALHSHMVDEEPRLYFMHFWANDDAKKLAQGLRAALDRVNVTKG